MTAPVAPMEARCDACHDTGSLSQHMDGFLDCRHCDAVENRLAMREHLAQFTAWPSTDTVAWAAYLFAQRQAAPVAPTQDIHCQEFHELAMAYRAAPAFTGAPAAYKALCDYVNARLAPVAQPAQQVGAVGRDWLFRSRTADLLHLIEFYPNISSGDEREAQKAISDLKSMLTAPQLEAQQAGDVEEQARGEGWLRAMDDVSALLPSTRYMDPPDGGSVTVLDQVARMALDAARYDWLREDAETHYVAIHTEPDHMDALSGEELDAAIDAAIAQGRKA